MDTFNEDINDILSADADYVVWYETLEREHEEACYGRWVQEQNRLLDEASAFEIGLFV